MTDFLSFASAHGLIVDRIDYGRWVRTKTIGHQNKRNGAFFHGGDFAHLQNWETMPEAVTWFADKPTDPYKIAELEKRITEAKRKHASERQEQATKAAKKAGWILSQCELSQHAYLDSKGFKNEQGQCWKPDENSMPLLVLPMRINEALVGCQMIDVHGTKKFLFGQRCNGAEFVFDNKGVDIWCEGYATALSIRACLKQLRIRYKLHVCFSAGNLQRMAKNGFVVADNDASGAGEKAAIATGLPYFLPPKLGHDFNDHYQNIGLTSAAFDLQDLICRQ